ncbi:hypothetical protein O6H91_16G001700 [Diphasiastrum complanatum]|uniref:Uncharacterized protein n=3 Tax=Diphasiastrum complanatum TaxID=34168 RepID=A0ACC2B997_DIPCM|nr:hypothetical protein O6H91_16G001700 [Diphasiastrum complanatum]KAJ7526316.1 hypothetical protein O6H91_16G001700 [Diphasiastrum complanatum]KAJ7526317.1 hypothetical protein O6H91_16G001700 [Diphasiastrum complanatum]
MVFITPKVNLRMLLVNRLAWISLTCYNNKSRMRSGNPKLLIGVLSLIFVFQLLCPCVKAHGGSSGGSDTNTTADLSSSGGVHLNLRATGLVVVKVWCLIIVFVATFFAGVSPYYYRWSNSFLVLGTQFAGGVFLATALIHFLSDADGTFKNHTNNPYPFAFMLATFGYLLTMFGDCVISWIYTRNEVENFPNSSQDMLDPETGSKNFGIKNEGGVVKPENASCCGETLEACKCEESVAETLEVKNVLTATTVKSASLGDALLLIVALCFHSIFEGIAIGVAKSQHDAWRNLWTVCLHKIFAAVAMGIALLRILPNRPLLSCASYSFSFAISTPIGIAIGIVIDSTSQGAVADWIYAISMGIACGVFIYVAINHLLAKGYIPPCQTAVDTPFFKFMAVTLGAAVISVVLIWD